MVGVLHTLVPDHRAPIVAIARQRSWSRAETARAAIVAGMGHVGSTLAIAIAVRIVRGAAVTRLGRFVGVMSSLALVGFSSRIALSAWRDKRWSSGHIARLRLGNGEVLSGAFITLIGAVFGLWPLV